MNGRISLRESSQYYDQAILISVTYLGAVCHCKFNRLSCLHLTPTLDCKRGKLTFTRLQHTMIHQDTVEYSDYKIHVCVIPTPLQILVLERPVIKTFSS